MDGADGKLPPEQQKQVTFIRKSAESLLGDGQRPARPGAGGGGKSVVRPSRFQVASLFGALRGVLRPLQVNEAVELIFEDVVGDSADVHRRIEGGADPAQLRRERAEVHGAGRGAGFRPAFAETGSRSFLR